MAFWSRLINADHPESPQLLTVALAGVTLPAVCAGIGLAATVRIWQAGDLGVGACWALGLSLVTLAVLAGYSDKINAIGLAGLIPGTSRSSVPTTQPGSVNVSDPEGGSGPGALEPGGGA